jgi:hypothetical protein
MPSAYYVDDYPSQTFGVQLFKKLKSENWKNYFQCNECKQFWCVDEFEKYQNSIAIRVKNIETISDETLIQIQMNLLVSSRDGLSNIGCIIFDCKNKSLKNLFYCPEHFYATGNRK